MEESEIQGHPPKFWGQSRIHDTFLPDKRRERLFFFLKVIYLVYVFACFALIQVCAPGGQKVALDALELELQVALSHHMGAGNETHILWENRQFS